MRVAFNCSQIFANSGIETYSRELLKALTKEESLVPILFTTKKKLKLLQNLLEDDSRARYIPNLPNPMALGERLINLTMHYQNFQIFKNSSKFDLYHITNNGFVRKSKNLIVTVHDIIPLFDNEDSKIKKNFLKSINNIEKYAKAVIVPTEYVKKQLIEYNQSFSNRTFAIYEAADKSFKPKEIFEIISIKGIDLNFEYFLSVGRVEKRKNLDRIISAFENYKKYHQSNEKLVLVINGQKERVNTFINKYSNSSDIVIFNGVEFNDLIKLYQNTKIFLFPSLEEGFGLPVIEAMQCGAPVITSNISCLPEIADDAAYLVNPYEEIEIAKALTKISFNDEIRNSLIEKGLQRAKFFNWKKAAKETYQVYQHVFLNIT